jgi:hypothetical protein
MHARALVESFMALNRVRFTTNSSCKTVYGSRGKYARRCGRFVHFVRFVQVPIGERGPEALANAGRRSLHFSRSSSKSCGRRGPQRSSCPRRK